MSRFLGYYITLTRYCPPTLANGVIVEFDMKVNATFNQ